MLILVAILKNETQIDLRSPVCLPLISVKVLEENPEGMSQDIVLGNYFFGYEPESIGNETKKVKKMG